MADVRSYFNTRRSDPHACPTGTDGNAYPAYSDTANSDIHSADACSTHGSTYPGGPSSGYGYLADGVTSNTHVYAAEFAFFT